MWPIRSNFRKHANNMRCHGICVQTKTHAEIQTQTHSHPTHMVDRRIVETREKSISSTLGWNETTNLFMIIYICVGYNTKEQWRVTVAVSNSISNSSSIHQKPMPSRVLLSESEEKTSEILKRDIEWKEEEEKRRRREEWMRIFDGLTVRCKDGKEAANKTAATIHVFISFWYLTENPHQPSFSFILVVNPFHCFCSSICTPFPSQSICKRFSFSFSCAHKLNYYWIL